MRKIIILIPVLVILFIAISFVFKKNKLTENQINGNDAKRDGISQVMKGVSLSPKSFAENDFLDFFEKAKQIGGVISWTGDWNELANLKTGGPAVLASLASKYDYVPIVEVQFFTQSTGRMLRAFNAATEENYKNTAVDFVKKYKPKYFGLGVEVNVLYEKSPADFEDFVSFFPEVYDAIKNVSPKTQVFTVFQLEKMKGLNGGLFGGINDKSKNQWDLLNKFPKSDIFAFTTYPGLVYKNPADVPIDYYSEIQSKTSKQIVFTEIGWYSGAGPVAWESSEAEQAEFIKLFFDLTKDMNKKFIIWSFLYDQKAAEPFNSMGLYGSAGNAKIGRDIWLNSK